MATDLGERLRTLRKERGLSQEALARRADIGLRGYGDLELGHATDPHISTLRGIARALDVSVEDLVKEPALPLAEAPPETGRRIRVMVTDTADATDSALVSISRDDLEHLFSRVEAQEISAKEAVEAVLA